MAAYGKASVLHWRMVNHAEAKAFLGPAYIAKLSKASRIISPAHHAHEMSFTANSDGTGPQMYAPLGSYIVRTDSGRLVAIDAEVFEYLTK
jgi:hypothetical protein